MKRISLDQLLQRYKSESYTEQYNYMIARIKKDEIRPVKASPLNGKRPALHQSYWLVEKQKNYDELLNELKFGLSTAISTDYYWKNPAIYEEERKWVKLLSQYLDQPTSLNKSISLNERSFQIWGREKFLQKEQGKRVLKHCNISIEQLNIYRTSEPLAYYSASRQVPQTILMIENKDTFFSMRRYLIENNNQTLFGEQIQTLVYGAGKGILRSIDDFCFCVEPYMNDKHNHYLYFGDLDYEGIGIYERLAELFKQEHKIIPFVPAYEKMLQKIATYGSMHQEDMDHTSANHFLPDTKEGQNRNISEMFFSFFKALAKEQMLDILEAEKYIPQEILNITDF